MPERQSPADMLARVEDLTASWQELSPQKRAAIRWLLDSHARLLAAAENALETHPIDPADYRRRHAGDLAPDGEQMCAAIEGLKAAIEAAGGGT